MKTLVDTRPKKSRAIADSFLTVPDVLTPGQDTALKELRKLLRFALTEKDNA